MFIYISSSSLPLPMKQRCSPPATEPDSIDCFCASNRDFTDCANSAGFWSICRTNKQKVLLQYVGVKQHLWKDTDFENGYNLWSTNKVTPPLYKTHTQDSQTQTSCYIKNTKNGPFLPCSILLYPGKIYSQHLLVYFQRHQTIAEKVFATFMLH